jgi:hypothetical protein
MVRTHGKTTRLGGLEPKSPQNYNQNRVIPRDLLTLKVSLEFSVASRVLRVKARLLCSAGCNLSRPNVAQSFQVRELDKQTSRGSRGIPTSRGARIVTLPANIAGESRR